MYTEYTFWIRVHLSEKMVSSTHVLNAFTQETIQGFDAPQRAKCENEGEYERRMRPEKRDKYVRIFFTLLTEPDGLRGEDIIEKGVIKKDDGSRYSLNANKTKLRREYLDPMVEKGILLKEDRGKGRGNGILYRANREIIYTFFREQVYSLPEFDEFKRAFDALVEKKEFKERAKRYLDENNELQFFNSLFALVFHEDRSEAMLNYISQRYLLLQRNYWKPYEIGTQPKTPTSSIGIACASFLLDYWVKSLSPDKELFNENSKCCVIANIWCLIDMTSWYEGPCQKIHLKNVYGDWNQHKKKQWMKKWIKTKGYSPTLFEEIYKQLSTRLTDRLLPILDYVNSIPEHRIKKYFGEDEGEKWIEGVYEKMCDYLYRDVWVLWGRKDRFTTYFHKGNYKKEEIEEINCSNTEFKAFRDVINNRYNLNVPLPQIVYDSEGNMSLNWEGK